nr:ribonuclease H-like domain-containing protein [Tanacetum cinerariifolium]
MSANDKFGIGYGNYRYGSILSYENEVLQSVFMNKECDLENTPVNDRYAKGMHTVPPSMKGIYMPSGSDVEINYSKFTYGLKQTSADESDSKPVDNASSDSDSSTDTPIIEEYESDSDDDLVSNVQEDKEKPSFAFTESVKHVKPSREHVKETCTPNHSPNIGKQGRNGHTRKGLGYAFTRKSCFVYGSFSLLIRDCDFHEKNGKTSCINQKQVKGKGMDQLPFCGLMKTTSRSESSNAFFQVYSHHGTPSYILCFVLNQLWKSRGDDLNDGDHPKTSNTSPPAMKMKHYLSHTDYLIWQVIHNRNGLVSVTTDTNGMIKVLPSKTAKKVMAKKRERKERTTLLMALTEDHLVKFHKMADANEMWEAIKSTFGGNDESKKMHKYLLKQQFEGFFVSSSKSLHKGYDKFQTVLSQLKIHGAGFSHEDANQKFLRSLTSFWSQVALIMRTKPGASQLDYDDLEEINDDDMEEMDLKWQVAMISMRIKKFHKRTGRKLQFDTKDPFGIDKTKVECFNCHKIGHFARECRAKGNQDSRRRDARYNRNKNKDNGRRPTYQDDSKDLVTINGDDIDWSRHVEEDAQNYAMMAYFSSNSGSDNEVKSCSKACEESYARLKKLYDDQRDKLGDASVETTTYTLALKSKLLNTQMSANDKFGLGYGDYRYGSILSYKNEVLQSMFMNKESDLEDTPVNDRYADGMHATSADESDSKPSAYASCEFDVSVETSTSMPEPVENASKVVCEPKVWTDAPIIEAQNYSSQASSTNTAGKVNTARPFMNETRPKRIFYKTHSPNKRPFQNTIAQRTTFSYQKVNIVGNKSLSAVGRNADTAVKASADSSQRWLGSLRETDRGCSRYMTGNKAHLADYQEFKGGSVAFGGSNGRITGKGKIKANREILLEVYLPRFLKMTIPVLLVKKESNTRPLGISDQASKQDTGDLMSAVQTTSKVNKNSEAHALISQALEDESWVDAMQEELLQFQVQKVSGYSKDFTSSRCEENL